ncbi:MAG: hypothetical protein ACOX32_09505 [Bacteroidaceae bacterium]|jgi:hypothetical protein|nr:hypothetical protein [Bacteroidaceae bacterium]MBP8603042.1 hypothetical protein [Bacteroidaceae bacterium]HOD69260.1 hypothetical protein [Bacteroidaceae bacterium]HQL26783.1 hypothetical protein [Bacteroidaceae bacterium]
MCKKLTILTLLLCLWNVAPAQWTRDDLMSHVNNVHEFNLSFPQEKVYLQFDNTSYFQGETIWFKAFVVNASTLTRAKSTVLYVDLLSPTGVLLDQQKLKIAAGQADGCFHLYDKSTEQARELRGVLPYPSGYYEIRAYTQNMLNFNESIIFSRVLPVFQEPVVPGYYSNPVLQTHKKDKESIRPEIRNPKGINVSFFPEGGSMTIDMPSRVAFKATDENGFPIEGTLRITISRSEGEIEAHTVHDGMGCFSLKSAKRNMKAVFIHEGKEYNVKMPVPDETDNFSITLSQTDDSLHLFIYEKNMSYMDRTFGLAVTCAGMPLTFKSFEWVPDSTYIKFSISSANFPMGVCKLTLFDNYSIYATRHFFNYREDFSPPQLSVQSDKESYAPYEQVGLSLSLLDGQGRPFRDRFCLSVKDANTFETLYQDNLATSLLLSSDLKGLINDPHYYFESNDEEHRLAMDLLMMVQGWERYDWETMSGKVPFNERHRLEDSLSVNGWVTSYWSNKVKLGDVKVYITVAPQGNDLPVQYAQYTTGKDGYFGFNVLDFYDEADLVMLLERKEKFARNTGANMILERAIQPNVRAFMNEELSFRKREVSNKTETTNMIAYPETPRLDDAIELPEVEIMAPRKYIDFFTFKAFDVEKEVEMVLDFGEWTTDVLGYLLDKGYTYFSGNAMISTTTKYTDIGLMEYLDDFGREAYAFEESGYLDDYPIFWYVHDSEKLYQLSFQDPIKLDIEDIESILIFDEPASLYEISESVPLFMDAIDKHINTAAILAMRGHLTSRKFTLIDIKMKDEHQLKTKKEKMNRGRRITTLRGFDYPVQFYSPQYPDGPIEGTKDYRRTLYWNPNVITDSLGNARIEFYNNSYSTRFNITGAGITAGGTPYVLDEDF